MEASRTDTDRRAAGELDLARAGAINAPIEIVEYDPNWPERFRLESERLGALTPQLTWHHIGSTAVPGLAAKPIIDMMALVDDLDAPLSKLVGRAGYQYPAGYNASLAGRRWLCRPSAAFRTHHLHLVVEQKELDRHLRFRDSLRASRALADEYAALKRTLAERWRDDREEYTAAKTEFIRRVDGLQQRG